MSQLDKAMEALAEVLEPVFAQRQARQFGLKHTASGTPIAAGYSHGPGGNFTFPGVDPAVFHTAVGNMGIMGRLPTNPSIYSDPTFEVLTGVTDTTGAEKDTVCENAPYAGLIKKCMLNSVFGRYERATVEIELNRLGKFNDRADPMDLALVGSPIHASGVFAQGPGNPATPGDLLVNEVSRKFWELGVAFHRLLSQQLWTGNPTNNSAGGGYMEMTGFQTLVATGHIDALTSTLCPSIDSDIKEFGCARLDDNQDRLITMLSELIRTRRDLAFRTGVSPVRFILAMRPELFWEITAIWPCSYLTYRCQVTGQERVNVDARDAVQFRDEMRAGKYLLIDGERIEVVLDDGIPVMTSTDNSTVAEGCQCSDIFLIPMAIIGGRAVTYMEYFDYGNPSLRAALAASNMILARQEGAFLIWPRQLNQCVVWQAKTEPRLIMRTPWLAGRINDVEYCPTQQARTPFPDDPYFVDGGVTTRPGPSFFSLWNPG